MLYFVRFVDEEKFVIKKVLILRILYKIIFCIENKVWIF